MAFVASRMGKLLCRQNMTVNQTSNSPPPPWQITLQPSILYRYTVNRLYVTPLNCSHVAMSITQAPSYLTLMRSGKRGSTDIKKPVFAKPNGCRSELSLLWWLGALSVYCDIKVDDMWSCIIYLEDPLLKRSFWLAVGVLASFVNANEWSGRMPYNKGDRINNGNKFLLELVHFNVFCNNDSSAVELTTKRFVYGGFTKCNEFEGNNIFNEYISYYYTPNITIFLPEDAYIMKLSIQKR